jgi:hypothetical protein
MRLLAGTLLIIAGIADAQAPASAQRATSQSLATACPEPAQRDTSRARVDTSRARRSTNEPASAESPTIVLIAEASAREVRFAAQPRIVVRLCGAVTDSVRVIERRNLPEVVQPGTTYRDVYIAVEIMGHLDAQCLARRIGVAPRDSAATDDCAALGIRDTSRATGPTRRPPP